MNHRAAEFPEPWPGPDPLDEDFLHTYTLAATAAMALGRCVIKAYTYSGPGHTDQIQPHTRITLGALSDSCGVGNAYVAANLTQAVLVACFSVCHAKKARLLLTVACCHSDVTLPRPAGQ